MDDMFQKAPLVMRLLAHGVRVSERAGQVIREVLSAGGDLGIVSKGFNDIQTKADRAAQHCIVASFTKKFPNYGFKMIGEEDYNQSDLESAIIESSVAESVLAEKCPKEWEAPDEKDVTIWIDPLDGTSEFSQSLKSGNAALREHVTVLIGIAVGSKPVAGIIHQPFFHRDPTVPPGRTVWGLDQLGAFGVLMTSPESPAARIIATTRSHATPMVLATIDAMQPTEVLRVGGAGHKVMLVIEGKAHAYVFASPGCKKWDTCAPEAVLRALGGQLTDLFGDSIEYHSTVSHPNSGGVLATPGSVDHQWFLDKVSAEVKEQLKPSK